MAQEDENERGRGANARMRFRQSAGQERENVRKASRSMRLLIAVDAALPAPEPGSRTASF